MLDDLSTLHDDMTAFVEGHGMRRFLGHVPDELGIIVWDADDQAESWKDFVELAKAAGAPFLTMNSAVLGASDVELLERRLQQLDYPNEDDIEAARRLRTKVGKTGFVQLGFPFQGVLFVCEISCEWYERYQQLQDIVEDSPGMTFDESDPDDEH